MNNTYICPLMSRPLRVRNEQVYKDVQEIERVFVDCQEGKCALWVVDARSAKLGHCSFKTKK